MITQEYLKDILEYDPLTGVFLWKKKIAKCIKIGNRAGFINGKGYERISINRTQHQSHRLAWLYVHGTMPEQQIDHINRIKTDNRIANLRDVSPSTNQENRKDRWTRCI